MRTLAGVTFVAATSVLVTGTGNPAYAQQPWSSLPGACASTDNNFYSGTPSSSYPVARFIVPGGSLTFSRFHEGHIAVYCTVDNPRYSGTQVWNQLQVTYSDPDGLESFDGYGTEYQVYVELARVSRTTGAWSSVARFDSNRQCTGTNCQGGDNTVRSIAVPFTHTFDFNNYAYAVYVRLYRALSLWGLSPAIYQVRLQATTITQPTPN